MRLGESIWRLNREKIPSFNMMEYSPWAQQQLIMDNQRYYAQYMEELSHYHHNHHHHHHQRSDLVEEDSEQTGDEMHDTITSATSCDRSSSADLFRLEFAASQWSKLVSNAEGLFNKLIVSNILPHTEQDQIEQWLCMKQEYEECITSDDTASFQGFADNARRSLEIIEEVTETDEKTDESENRMDYRDRSDTCSETESEISEEDDEDDEEDDEDDEEDDVDDDEEEDDDDDEDQSDTNSENPDFAERLDECMNKFIFETDGFIDSNKEFREPTTPTIPQISTNNNDTSPIMKPMPRRNPNMRRNSMLPGSEMCNGLLAFNDNFKLTQAQNIQTDSSNSISLSKISETAQSSELEPQNNNNEIAIMSPLENSPNPFLDVLRNSESPGPIKELKALTKNNKAKQKEVLKIQSDLEGAHKRIEELQSTIKIKERFIAEMIQNSDTKSCAKQRFHHKQTKLKEEYYNTRTQLAHAESAFTTNETGERSTYKKEIELYRNMAFHYEKKLMDIEMIKRIAGDSARKVRELENSLSLSKKQMEELTRQLKKEERLKKQLEDEVAEDQKKIRDLEEKYNLTASKLKEIQSESEDERAKSRSERISYLDQVLREKSMDLEKIDDTDEKKALRHEIQNFRCTRDRLIDEKLHKEKTFTTVDDERDLFECRETIDVIDAVIEHKNEMICGRKDFDEDLRKRNNGMCLEQLDKLTDGEMKNLFHTYFSKVVDLKQNLQSLESHNQQLEIHNEKLEKENVCLKHEYRTMFNVLKQVKLEAEKRDVLRQEKYQRQSHLMLKHFAENSSSSGQHEKIDNDSEIARYRKENRILKKRLQDAEAHNKSPPTKVTREKNKLIIQKTTDPDKKKK